jgi:hypothetical protein
MVWFMMNCLSVYGQTSGERVLARIFHRGRVFAGPFQREKSCPMDNPICTGQKHSTSIASQQRAPGRTACLAGATQHLRRHAARPGIPLLGALDVATVKYPG